MLVNVNVKNLALIREAEISFDKGLNILTGETGAGKSIVIGSINIALGGKITKDIVREGAPFGLVELLFDIEDKATVEKLRKLDVELEEGRVIISRKITGGRSTIKVNGESKTAAELRKITSLLIDVHGQHDHQSLLDESKHMEIIDKMGHESISPIVEKVKKAYDEYNSIVKEIEAYGMDEEERQREISFAQFEIDEIENANLADNEDDELEEEYKLLSNAGRIINSFSSAYNIIEGDDSGNVCDLLGNAYRYISGVMTYDSRLYDYADRMSELESLSRDLAADMQSFVENMNFSDERLSTVTSRLDIVNRLKQKYGNSISDILSYCEERQTYLEKLVNLSEELNNAKERYAVAKKNLDALCDRLTKERKHVASKLSKEIIDVLSNLNFLYVDFKAEFEKSEHYSSKGNDIVRFKITTNPGEPLRPLAKVASGGELSRIMLGLKTIMAKQDEIDTLIFDEIDTGISGRTAQLVAEKMNLISRNHQVICITHLPQIAAMADHHYLIEKNIVSDETVTSINKLDEDNSIKELVRILGGAKISETVFTHAREMKKMAVETKLSQS